MSHDSLAFFGRATLVMTLLAACGDDAAGSGGAGGLEPCTDCTSSQGGGDGDGDGDGDGGDATASTGSGEGGAPAGPSSSSSSGQGGDGGSGPGGGGPGGGGPGGGGSGGGEPGEGELVINELSATGDDWVELFNVGDADLDVGGLRVADEDEPGVPNVAEAVEIPAGTILGAGEYLFILLDQDEASDGFVDACEPGPAPCLVGVFGITGGGDEVFVLDTDDTVLQSVVYPGDATVEGESWGRLPNGTGDFEVNAPTPGAANEAP